MWNPLRRAKQSSEVGGLLGPTPAGRAITAAFRDLAGTPYGALYDLPRSLRPEPIPGSIFLRGTPAWRRYLDARERADVGQPAILFALRVLDDEERNLAVDWGATYPNTFCLIEPHDPECDLTDAGNPATVRLMDAAERAAREGDGLPAGYGPEQVGSLLRELFGTWVSWTGPAPWGDVREIPLRLSGPDDTFWSLILAELDDRYPQQAFDRALAYINDWERELLGGPVSRARSVFRTRLGMPMLRDANCVDRAVRRLVNEGRMTAVAASWPGRPVFGRGRPVPEEISDEQFATFLIA